MTKKEIFHREIKRLSLFANPTSRGGKGKKLVEDFKKKFSGKGIENIDFFDTMDFKNLEEQSKKALKADDHIIAICGGDGTLNMIMSKLIDLFRELEEPIPFILIPFGTGNDFYASLEFDYENTLSKRAKKVVSLPLDMGLITWLDKDSKQVKQRAFTCQVGLAFSSEAVRLGNKLGIFGRYKYKVGAIIGIMKKKAIRVKVILDDVPVEGTEYDLVQIQNTQLVGGGMRLCPFASIEDGLIDVLLAKPMSRRQLINLFDEAKKGGAHVYAEKVHYYRCKKIRLEFEGNMIIQVDGDLVEVHEYVEMTLLPKLVSYIV